MFAEYTKKGYNRQNFPEHPAHTTAQSMVINGNPTSHLLFSNNNNLS